MSRFTQEQLDYLYSIQDIGKFLTNKYPPTQERLIKIYDSIFYPLCTQSADDKFYHCVIHPGWHNINFSSFIHHCLVTDPDKHKQYIEEKLFKKHV